MTPGATSFGRCVDEGGVGLLAGNHACVGRCAITAIPRRSVQPAGTSKRAHRINESRTTAEVCSRHAGRFARTSFVDVSACGDSAQPLRGFPAHELHSIRGMPSSDRTALTKGFIVELDGLRGIAILMVMVHRFWPRTGVGVAADVAGAGWIGVDLFFVISGFLIAGILLDTRGERRLLPQLLRAPDAAHLPALLPVRDRRVRRVLGQPRVPRARGLAALVPRSTSATCPRVCSATSAVLARAGVVARDRGAVLSDVPVARVRSSIAGGSRCVLVAMIAVAPVIRLVTMLALPEHERVQYLFTLVPHRHDRGRLLARRSSCARSTSSAGASARSSPRSSCCRASSSSRSRAGSTARARSIECLATASSRSAARASWRSSSCRADSKSTALLRFGPLAVSRQAVLRSLPAASPRRHDRDGGRAPGSASIAQLWLMRAQDRASRSCSRRSRGGCWSGRSCTSRIDSRRHDIHPQHLLRLWMKSRRSSQACDASVTTNRARVDLASRCFRPEHGSKITAPTSIRRVHASCCVRPSFSRR